MGIVTEQFAGEILKELKAGEILKSLGRVAIHWGVSLGAGEIPNPWGNALGPEL